MNIDLSGDALRLLEHFIHYSSLYPERLADAMRYDLDGFICRLRCLDKAFRLAVASPVQTRAKKGQPPLPDDFDRRFPEPIGGKIREWLTYKTERKDFYSPTGLRNLLTQVDNKAKDYSAVLIADLIAECMANNWKGIIWDRIKQQDARSYGRRDRRSAERRAASSVNSAWAGFLEGDEGG